MDGDVVSDGDVALPALLHLIGVAVVVSPSGALPEGATPTCPVVEQPLVAMTEGADLPAGPPRLAPRDRALVPALPAEVAADVGRAPVSASDLDHPYVGRITTGQTAGAHPLRRPHRSVAGIPPRETGL